MRRGSSPAPGADACRRATPAARHCDCCGAVLLTSSSAQPLADERALVVTQERDGDDAVSPYRFIAAENVAHRVFDPLSARASRSRVPAPGRIGRPRGAGPRLPESRRAGGRAPTAGVGGLGNLSVKAGQPRTWPRGCPSFSGRVASSRAFRAVPSGCLRSRPPRAGGKGPRGLPRVRDRRSSWSASPRSARTWRQPAGGDVRGAVRQLTTDDPSDTPVRCHARRQPVLGACEST
jgi:hypothetical protein